MKSRVYLSLGSNIEPRRFLRSALQSLREAFGPLDLSPVYESKSVGFEGDNFLNLVVAMDVDLPLGELSLILRNIEDAHGRVRGREKFTSRTLDIDILTYGELVGEVDGIQLPRDEIEKYAFVLLPLADIAPLARYPRSGQTYAELCANLVVEEGDLWPVEFDLPAT